MEPVRRLLRHIKRCMERFVSQREELGVAPELSKPRGSSVREMFRTDMCESGAVQLPAGDCDLEVGEASLYHVEACEDCREAGSLQEGCYFATLLRCLSHGWKPRVVEEEISPVYVVTDNYQTIASFPDSVSKEFAKMVDNGVVEEVAASTAGVWHPMGAVIKNSDRRKAMALAGIEIKDQPSLELASKALSDKGLPIIKARITHDCTASGLNRTALCPPFRYPSLAEGLRLVVRNGWLAKTDISRYFHQFPLALESRHLFLLRLHGKYWRSKRLLVGFGPCPYYTSIWSAEYKLWAEHLGIPVAHMMDDYLTGGATREEVERKLDRLCAMFVRVGHVIQIEKNEIGQRLIDTVRMMVSFDSTQAKGMRAQLATYLDRIKMGHDLDQGTIRHVAGSLNWYAEVVQSGRTRLRSWWSYLRYASKLNLGLRLQLVQDTEWWLELLGKWSEGGVMGVEYPILNAKELASDDNSIWVVQSDASGPDGFGYYHGCLTGDAHQYVSRVWGGEYFFGSSHNGEMQSLLHFLRYTAVRCKVLVWISDSLSAVWSVNKGRCRAEGSLAVLNEILRLCDVYHLQLLALWVPREDNMYADYLSHLASSLCREEVVGAF